MHPYNTLYNPKCHAQLPKWPQQPVHSRRGKKARLLLTHCSRSFRCHYHVSFFRMPAFPAAAASAVRGTSGSWPVLQLLFLHSHRHQCSCWSGLRQSNAPRQTRRAPSKSQLPHAPAPTYLEQLSISPRSPADWALHADLCSLIPQTESLDTAPVLEQAHIGPTLRV